MRGGLVWLSCIDALIKIVVTKCFIKVGMSLHKSLLPEAGAAAKRYFLQ
jgi:hypothetical protein